MRNIFKNLLFCGALAAAGGAFAAPIDGVYQCTYTSFPLSTTVYQAFITNAQGQTATAPVTTQLVNTIHGYGIGSATATTYTGTDSNGAAFAFVITGNTLTGTMSLNRSGIATPAQVVCNRIF